jgi:DNA-binding NarL/FixJ family response regulator
MPDERPQHVSSRQVPVDIVVTDLGMAEMDGYELGHILHEERPDLPCFESRFRRMGWSRR